MSSVHYYLNGVAQQYREARSDGAYPAGSVIVKEKLIADPAAKDRGFTRINAVAGMIKRERGASPETGDWEFFYFSPRSAPSDGKAGMWEKAADLKSCVSCHSNAKDMVFGRFNEPYVTPSNGEPGGTIRLEVAPSEDQQLGLPK
jgi:hypothetical protein